MHNSRQGVSGVEKATGMTLIEVTRGHGHSRYPPSFKRQNGARTVFATGDIGGTQARAPWLPSTLLLSQWGTMDRIPTNSSGAVSTEPDLCWRTQVVSREDAAILGVRVLSLQITDQRPSVIGTRCGHRSANSSGFRGTGLFPTSRP